MAPVVDMFPETKLKPEDDPNSRFTTREMMAWLKTVTAAELDFQSAEFEFDLDPFAHPESHWGREWWTKADNAYERSAHGLTFVNGPWDECPQVVAWIRNQLGTNERLFAVTQVLPGNRQEQEFWQRCIEPLRDRRDRKGIVVTTHYPPGRTSYGIPGAPNSTKWSSGLNVNSVGLVWRFNR